MTQPTNPAASPRETVLGGVGQADATQDKARQINKDFEDKTPPAHKDSALESIGKAVTAPVRDAADESSDERPGES